MWKTGSVKYVVSLSHGSLALTQSFSLDIFQNQQMAATVSDLQQRLGLPPYFKLLPLLLTHSSPAGFFASSPSSVPPTPRPPLRCTSTSSLHDRLTDIAMCTLFKHLLYYNWVTALMGRQGFFLSFTKEFRWSD